MKHRRLALGFSLMEVMVSIGILAVAALSILTVFVGGLRMMQRSNEMAAATNVAKSVLEAIKRDVRAFDLGAIPGGVYSFDGRVPHAAQNTGTNSFPPGPYPQIKVDNQAYTVLVEGQEEGSRLRRIKVSVFWNQNQAIKLETLIHP